MAEGLELAVLVCWSVLLLGVLSLLMRFLSQMWLKPARIRSVLLKQGIRGPRPTSFLVGNVPEMQKIQSNAANMMSNLQKQQSDVDGQRVQHNWDSSMFPYLQQWAREYGPVFLYSTGAKQHMYVSDPKLLRELKLHNSLNLCRPKYLSKPLKPLLCNGLIVANGHEWAYQRKLIAPEFFLDKVKGMVGLMEESTMALLETWDSRIQESESSTVEMRIDQDLKALSADIISRACFGSSYSQGNEIFAKIAFLQDALSKPNLLFGFLNFRFFRTETDKKIRIMNEEVDAMLLKLVNDRRAQTELGGLYEKDLLQLILESAASLSTDMPQYKHKTDRFILDNCRNIYFAGSETTALTVSWTLMLLSLHPEWQERIRAEIVEVCGDRELYHCLKDMDTVRKFKTLTMVILESLRLYGPEVIAAREALSNMKLGDLDVPEGIHMWVYYPALHRDTENWGLDANEFKPERFANGVSESCKYPQAYMPFGFGTRLCIGQTFAMLQLKIVLTLILSKFSFSLSPNYRHSPVYKMLLLPEHGIRLIVRRVQ